MNKKREIKEKIKKENKAHSFQVDSEMANKAIEEFRSREYRDDVEFVTLTMKKRPKIDQDLITSSLILPSYL